MPSENLRDSAEQLRALLRQERERVLAELRAYPPPVPACDVQFNDLLQQRDNLGRASGRLDVILNADLDADARAQRLKEFRRDFSFTVSEPATS